MRIHPSGICLREAEPAIDLEVPAVSRYNVTITDALGMPRSDLFVAAIRPEQSADFQGFHTAKATMQKWNEDYAG
jgi:hypothetical protein